MRNPKCDFYTAPYGKEKFMFATLLTLSIIPDDVIKIMDHLFLGVLFASLRSGCIMSTKFDALESHCDRSANVDVT